MTERRGKKSTKMGLEGRRRERYKGNWIGEEIERGEDLHCISWVGNVNQVKGFLINKYIRIRLTIRHLRNVNIMQQLRRRSGDYRGVWTGGG